MRILLIDPSVAGVSGDMFLAALLDLGAPAEVLQRVIDSIERQTGKELELKVVETERKGIRCTQVELRVEEDFQSAGYTELKEYLELLLERCALSRRACNYARRCLETLIEGEERIHRGGHLHELGSVDTLFDIAGAAALLDAINVWKFRVISTPVNVGSGTVRTSHGELSVPLPLTADILRVKGVPFVKRHRGELATPTGLALLSNLVHEFSEELPVVRLLRTGRGAGTVELDEAPNLLQLHLCESSGIDKEQISLLETSVDDVTGEVLGSTIGELLKAGALDVQVIPTVTKKNRPGHVLQVLCRPGEEERLAEVMMRTLGTLGVRYSRMSMRFALRREVRRVDVQIGDYRGHARVKLGLDREGRVVSLKPEYQDAAEIAERLRMPVREVLARIACRARARFKFGRKLP